MPASAAPPPPEVAAAMRSALDRLADHPDFPISARHRALLRYLLTHTLAGDAGALKETMIAVEVLGRPADRFDPSRDSIVRVEMRRLRARLSAYYQGPGRLDPGRLRLQPGHYALQWEAGQVVAPASATRRARDLVERGEYFLRQPITAAHLAEARARFEQACAEAPDHAPAWAGLGRAWLNTASSWSEPPGPASAQAARALDRALQLNPHNALAQTLRAALHHQFDWDWERARRGFERAISLAPEQAFVHSAHGCHLLYRGRPRDAEQALQRARALDPHYLATRMHLVNLRLRQGRLDDARAELAAVLDLTPEGPPALALAALIALEAGETTAALAHAERACTLAAQAPGYQALRAGVLGALGRIDEAQAQLRRLDSTGTPLLSPYALAVAQLRCGDATHALTLLDRAITLRDPNLVMLDADPCWRSLREHSGWAALMTTWRAAAPGMPPPAAH